MALESDAGTIFIFLLIMFLFVVFVLIAYVYQSLSLYYIAKKTKTPNEWLAWIPIGNLVLMANIAKMHWWPVLLYIPGMFFMFLSITFALFENKVLEMLFSVLSYFAMIAIGVYMIIWTWKIYENVSRPGYWAIVPVVITSVAMLLVIVGLIILNVILFWLGIILIIVGVLQQYVYLGLAAWHKDSIHKNTKKLIKN